MVATDGMSLVGGAGFARVSAVAFVAAVARLLEDVSITTTHPSETLAATMPPMSAGRSHRRSVRRSFGSAHNSENTVRVVSECADVRMHSDGIEIGWRDD